MKNVIKQFKKHYSILLLILLIIFHTINNYKWLRLDTQPPEWCDQVSYFVLSLGVHNAIHVFSIDQLMHVTSGIRPPLVYLLATPLYFLAGTSPDVACMSNILYLTILVCSVYGITKKISNKKIGLLSAFIVSTFPMIFGMSRQFLMDLPLTAMVSLSIYFLLCTDHFNNRIYSILFGISVALGMLIKPAYPFFVLFPFLYIIKNDIIKTMKMLLYPKQFLSELKQRKSILNIVFTVVIAVGLASIWYIPNLDNILWLNSANRGGEGVLLINLQSILFYPIGMINYQISFFYFLIFIVLIVLTSRQFSKSSIRTLKSDDGRMILILWVIIPYLIFAFYFPFKEFRYLLPSIPPIAIAVSLMVDRITNNRNKLMIVIIILLVGSAQFFALTYGTNALPNEISVNTTMQEPLNKVVIFSQEHRWEYPGFWEVSWTYPPKKEDWKINDIIDVISENTVRDTPDICFIPHCERFHVGTFWYYQILHNKGNMIFHHPNYLQFKENIQNYDYVIVKDRNNCGVFCLCDDINKTHNLFLKNSRNFTIIKSISLPDGSEIYVYQKNIRFADGWYGLESWHYISTRWTSNNATIFVYPQEDKSTNLSFDVLSFYKPRTLQVYLNDELIREQENPTSFVEVEIPVKLKEGENILRYHTPDGCQRPCDIPELKNNDSRCLSLAFQNVNMGENR